MTWPFPGDAPIVRTRRVALAYRALAQRADPAAVADLDARVADWGETWAVPRLVTHQAGAWLSAREAAEVACVKPDTLRVLRHRGRLSARRTPDGRSYEYLADDIEALKSPRSRTRPGVSDKVAADGTRVPETRPDTP